MKKFYFLVSFLLLTVNFVWGQAAGDIAIIGVNSDVNKSMVFVALADIPANTNISFTDNAWDATNQVWRTGEGTIVWSTSSVVTAGTVITITLVDPYSVDVGSVTNVSGFNLATSGDQVLSYLGTTAPTINNSSLWLYGFSLENFAWGNNSNSSDIPTALINYSVAMTTSTTEIDNAYFANGSTTQTSINVSGTKAELLALFTDASKYYKNDAGPLTFPSYTITVNTGTAPILTTSTTSLDGFTYVEGSGPSTSQSYTLSGTNLDGSNVTITAPTYYEISLDDVTYTNEIILNAYDGTDTDIYVRMIAGLSAGTYDNEDIIHIGGGGNTANVTCNGFVTSTGGVANHVIIAEIYGGGGNNGAPYTNDYIVLYNPTNNPVDLSTWSVQYTSATGTNWSNITNLIGIIGSNNYYLIQQESGGSNGVPLPITPNVIGTIIMSATAGKLALVNDQEAISGKSDENVVDFVGYGTTASEYEGSGHAPTPSNSSSIRRKDNSGNNTYGTNGNGWDTNDNANDFYIENDLGNNAPLPVELTFFSASVIGSKVKLNWATATEVNNFGFDILRQAQDDNGWTKIGFVNGNGNSNSPKSYSFSDKEVTYGKYIYRLKQIDNDGQYEYSKTVEINLGAPKNYGLDQNYPNPFNPITTISYNLPEASNVKLTVYNLLGQEVKVLVDDFKEAGSHNVNFDADNLNSGLYIYKLQAGSFTQTRKMTLIK